MPCEAMSSPASSSSSETRNPIVFLISEERRVGEGEHERERRRHADRLDAELADRRTERRVAVIPYQTPGAAPSRISRGEANRPTASVPQMPARPCAESAPTGSSRLLVDREDAEDDDHAGDQRR